MDQQQQTNGQKRMRTSFNPSSESVVDGIKQKCADLIDIGHAQQNSEEGGAEVGWDRFRCAEEGMNLIELGGMMLVKAATTGK